MTALAAGRPMLRAALLWGIPAVLLAVIVGVELYNGRGDSDAVPPEPVRAPAPVTVGLLPAYTIAGGPDALQAIGDHTLFNPTRKPAPPAETTANGPTRLQRGQFVLTGTQVFGDKAVAYLKGAKDGKARTVRLGDTVEGMRVASITPNTVRFAVDQESEELTLKVATGPKATIQPVIEPSAPPGVGQPLLPQGGTPGGPATPVPANGGGNANGGQAPVGQSLAERRRAARAAQAGAAAAQPSGTNTGAGSATRGRQRSSGATTAN